MIVNEVVLDAETISSPVKISRGGSEKPTGIVPNSLVALRTNTQNITNIFDPYDGKSSNDKNDEDASESNGSSNFTELMY